MLIPTCRNWDCSLKDSPEGTPTWSYVTLRYRMLPGIQCVPLMLSTAVKPHEGLIMPSRKCQCELCPWRHHIAVPGNTAMAFSLAPVCCCLYPKATFFVSLNSKVHKSRPSCCYFNSSLPKGCESIWRAWWERDATLFSLLPWSSSLSSLGPSETQQNPTHSSL